MDIIKLSATAFAFIILKSANASGIVINEFLPNPVGTDTGNEWIELYNDSTALIDISGWEIQKATASYASIFTFSTNAFLQPGEYLVVAGINVAGADIQLSSLKLGNAGTSGDALRLIDDTANVIDTVIYGPNNNDAFFDDLGAVAYSLAPQPVAGFSLGRLTDGADTDYSGVDFVRLDNPSIGFSNEVSAVPAPASLWLFGSGLVGLCGIARRAQR